MRTLCLLLILANVLFFVWSQLIDVQVGSLDRAPARIAKPPPRIVLAHEDEEASEPEPTEQVVKDVLPPTVEPLAPPATLPPPQVAGADALSCTTVGPFADLPQASQAQAALRAAGFHPRQRVVQGEIWVGYWVSVQDLANRNEAEDALKTLRANGITDVYLMPASNAEQVLSLGVFSDYQRAQRRAREVRTLGLSPQVDDRTRPGSVYWIDVDLEEPGQIIDSSIFQTVPGKITRLEMRACPPEAAG